MAYLKKKKMYEMLQTLVDTGLDMMKNATYKFRRNAEWLECESKGTDYYRKYKLYHDGYFISLDILQWDEEKEMYVEIDRITYRMFEEKLVKEYQRTEAYAQTEEIKNWIENHKINGATN